MHLMNGYMHEYANKQKKKNAHATYNIENYEMYFYWYTIYHKAWVCNPQHAEQ